MPSKSRQLKLNKQPLTLETVKASTIENGIKLFCRNRNMDLVVVVSRKHSVFYNLFKESVTKRVAFSARVPVMAIHE